MSRPDHLMTQEALVIERTVNGVIVRPHRGWWREQNDTPFPEIQVRVFNDLAEFQKWFRPWFPKESADVGTDPATPKAAASRAAR